MSIYNVLNTAITSCLTAGTTVTGLLAGTTSIYFSEAPPGAAMPYVVWNYQGGGELNLTPKRMKSELVLVAAYARDRGLAGTIDAAIDPLLHGQTLTVSGWTNYWTSREGDFTSLEYEPTGQPVFGVGAYYRVELSK